MRPILKDFSLNVNKIPNKAKKDPQAFSYFKHLDPENQHYCSIYREMLATKVRHSTHSFGLYLELYIWFPISYVIFKFVFVEAINLKTNNKCN